MRRRGDDVPAFLASSVPCRLGIRESCVSAALTGSGESAPLDFNRIAWAAPVAGVIVGLIGAGALGLTRLFGLPPLLCAGLATAAMVAATGALPEDGLSDVAGGFGGGSTRERKLEIMRDSRIGAYGAVALALVLILRAAALASALAHDFLAPRRGAKTSLKDARADGFDFLGYRFGPRYGQKGKRYLGARPSAKSLKRIKGKISDLLRPGNMGAWPQVRGWLNRLLGGWSAYFSYGTLNAAYRSVDRHVCDRVRRFLNRRSKRDGRGARHYSWSQIFGKLEVRRLTRVALATPTVSLT